MILLLSALCGAWAAPPEPQTTWVETDDGFWVALHRRANPGARPVVLVHGVSSNARFWDLEEGRSLAQTLHEAGWDVWNLDLRGHGAAERNPDGKRQKVLGTIDQHGAIDLPAALAHVRAATGKDQVQYVGHSMGGMVLAVHLARTPDSPVSSAAIVGSPLDFRDPNAMIELMLGGAPLARYLKRLPTPLGAKVLAQMKSAAPGELEQLVHNPENMARDAEKHMLRTVVSPLHHGEIAQFAKLRHDGEFRSLEPDGLLYREALADVRVPMLFIAGRADHIVSPDRVWTFYDSLGTDDKAFVVASVANGFHADYGHLDLGLGDHVHDDVFVRIIDWLQDHP